MRIAAIVRDLAPGTGLNLVVENLLAGLAAQHEIRLFLLFPGYYANRQENTGLPYPREEYTTGSAKPEKRKLSRASRYYGADPERLAWIESRVADFGADRVVGFDYNMAPFVGLLRSGAPKILNAVDSEILYYLGQMRKGNLGVAVLKHLVAAILSGREHFRKFAATVTVSPSDTENLKWYTGAHNIFTVPNGVDYARFTPDHSIRRNPDRVIFCGSLSFLPNVQAVEWFLGECWSEIRRAHPKAEFLIIGKNPPAELAPRLESNPGVRVTGFVDDVRPHILESAVSIAPMVSGTGIKNKILEAWALATPVVATRLAVKGLVCEHDSNLLIAKSSGDFAKAVVSLLGDRERRERMGAAGRTHVMQNYSWGASRAKFNSIVEQPSKYREIGSQLANRLSHAARRT